MPKFSHAIVVGASSGIGREIVRQLAATGTMVAALSRRAPDLEALAKEFPGFVLPYCHDVNDFDSVPQLFQDITTDLGGLDLFVYSSGAMLKVEPEEFDFVKDRHMIEVNVLGAMAWLNLAATRFGSAGHGSIVAIGSVAGDRGRAGQPAYNTSKAALATYMEALRNRLSKKGVKVVTIKPGPVATPMIAGLGFKDPMPVEVAARKIIAKADKTGEHYLKLTHHAMFFVIRHIPSLIFRRMKL